MARPSRPRLPLPPPIHPIQRVHCSRCDRSWGVYAGHAPHGWAVLPTAVVCDRCRRREEEMVEAEQDLERSA